MVQLFKDLARKNFSFKFQGNLVLGSIALNLVREKFGIKITDNDAEIQNVLSGYVRYHTLFLKTSDPELKIKIFKEKMKIIQEINFHFEQLGYLQKIKELRFL